MTIIVSGVVLPVWEEELARALAPWIPPTFICDGCSAGCPDTYPVHYPPRLRLHTRIVCVGHDAHPAYEPGAIERFGVDYAVQRAAADAFMWDGWMALRTLQADRFRLWPPNRKLLYLAEAYAAWRMVRRFGAGHGSDRIEAPPAIAVALADPLLVHVA